MKVGDLIRHKRPERHGLGLIVEMVSWKKTEYKIPFVLWDDGRCAQVAAALLELINESR